MTKTLILYGSLTGNTEYVAQKIQQILTSAKKTVQLKNANQTSAEELNNYQYLVLGSSTWDEGQLQYDFEAFMAELKAKPPDLKAKKIAVFGCGDSSYEQFCAAVDTLEKKFQALGGEKIITGLKIDGIPQLPENKTKVEEWAKELAEKL